MAISKERSNQQLEKENQTNGVVTVNDESNPTKQERDEAIGQEPDTERLRSERESVSQNSGDNNSL